MSIEKHVVVEDRNLDGLFEQAIASGYPLKWRSTPRRPGVGEVMRVLVIKIRRATYRRSKWHQRRSYLLITRYQRPRPYRPPPSKTSDRTRISNVVVSMEPPEGKTSRCAKYFRVNHAG